MARQAFRLLPLGLAALLAAGATAAWAIPPPAAPRGRLAPVPSPTPATNAPTLPFGSPIYFVLDDRVSSGSTAAGSIIRMHLRSPLVVNGVTLAPAGAPDTLEVVSTRKPASGDVDGAVQIHIEPLALPGRPAPLPIRAVHEYLTIELTAGQESTRATTDTIGDIFIPYHMLYHALRPGRQLVLPVGSILRAETAATIDARNRSDVVLATPQPFISTYDAPHSDITPAPFYTPAPTAPRPLPHGRPTLPPSPSPSPSVAASGSPSSAAPAQSSSSAPRR